MELRAAEEAQGIGGAMPQMAAADRILAEQARLNVAAVEMEKARLEKIKAKQAKEIEQVGSSDFPTTKWLDCHNGMNEWLIFFVKYIDRCIWAEDDGASDGH